MDMARNAINEESTAKREHVSGKGALATTHFRDAVSIPSVFRLVKNLFSIIVIYY